MLRRTFLQAISSFPVAGWLTGAAKPHPAQPSAWHACELGADWRGDVAGGIHRIDWPAPKSLEEIAEYLERAGVKHGQVIALFGDGGRQLFQLICDET